MQFIAVPLFCMLMASQAVPALAGGKEEMNEGAYSLSKGNFTAAVEHYNAALQSGEFNGEALSVMLISRGQAHYHLKNFDLAAGDLTLAIDSGFMNNTLVGIALATRASVYRLDGKLDLAIEDFDAAIELGTVNDKMYFHRGLTLEEAGQALRAVEDFRRAFEMAPDNDGYRDKLLELGGTIN